MDEDRKVGGVYRFPDRQQRDITRIYSAHVRAEEEVMGLFCTLRRPAIECRPVTLSFSRREKDRESRRV
jgi:hypothetical protein